MSFFYLGEVSIQFCLPLVYQPFGAVEVPSCVRPRRMQPERGDCLLRQMLSGRPARKTRFYMLSRADRVKWLQISLPLSLPIETRRARRTRARTLRISAAIVDGQTCMHTGSANGHETGLQPCAPSTQISAFVCNLVRSFSIAN